MIDGHPAATSLSTETYLAGVQVEKYSGSLLIHHPIIVNHNYLSDSHHTHSTVLGSVIRGGERDEHNDSKGRLCRMTPLGVST